MSNSGTEQTGAANNNSRRGSQAAPQRRLEEFVLRWLARISVRGRMVGSALMALVLLLLVAQLGNWGVGELEKQSAEVLIRNAMVAETATRVHASAEGMRLFEKQILIDCADRKVAGKHFSSWKQELRDLDSGLAILDELAANDAVRHRVGRVREHLVPYQKGVRALFAAVGAGKAGSTPAAITLMAPYEAAGVGLISSTHDLARSYAGHLDRGKIALHATARWLRVLQWSLSALAFFAAMVGANLLTKSVAHPQLQLTEAIFLNAPLGIVVVSAEGAVEASNPAFRVIVNKDEVELEGVSFGDLLCEDDRGRHAEIFGALERGELEVDCGDLCFECKDGRAVTGRTVLRSIRAKDGELLRSFAIVEDVRERLALEAKLRQSQKLESIGLLAAGIAHEINTPTQFVGDNTVFLGRAFSKLIVALESCQDLLTAKGGAPQAELMKKAAKSLKAAKLDFMRKQVPRAVKQSLEGVERVAHIVGAMKEFAHPSQGQKNAADLSSLIDSTAMVSRNEWKYHAELETDFDPQLPPVPCIRDELSQVILNLIVNAAQAIATKTGGDEADKGTIRLRTRRDGDFAELQVSDTGGGIPEAAQPRIFDPFFTTKAVGKGTGQGLAIAHDVVDKHGGTIGFETELGKGTTFTIRLPLATSQPPSSG